MSTELIQQVSLTEDTFIWQTKSGLKLRIGDMETSHIFNTVKMLFNHLAVRHGGDPVNFEFHYGKFSRWSREDPQGTAAIVIFFIEEILRRNDLPKEYHSRFIQITNQILGIRRLSCGDDEIALVSSL